MSASDLNSPPNLYQVDVDGGNEEQLTQFNADLLSTLALPAVERLSFSSGDGVSS